MVACEYSGIVRDAFIQEGFDAVSCDLDQGKGEGPHLQRDALEVMKEKEWDAVIAHPPCTYLCNSGVRWLKEREGREEKMKKGAKFFKQFLDADIDYIAVENPVMHKYAVEIIGRRQDFTCQPWQFGDAEKKRVCWWTKNLPELEPTDIVPEDEREAKVHNMAPSEDRGKKRSEFFPGMAKAMAKQWGKVIREGQKQKSVGLFWGN